MGPIIPIIIIDTSAGSPPGTISDDNAWTGGWTPLPD